MGLQVIRYGQGVPVAWCNICGDPFYEGEELARVAHVDACFKRHEQEVLEQALTRQAPGLFDDNYGDTGLGSLQEWIDRNRDAILEGRKKL